jgi:hypothetical protein
MIFPKLTNRLKKGIVIVTMVSLIGVSVPIDSSLQPQRAAAQLVVQDPLNLAQNTITAAFAKSLEVKELTLDAIAWSLAKRAVSQMTSDIVAWINSGFQGNPMFITDLGGFLTDIADQVAGDVLYELAGDLCTPFQLNITLALKIQKQKGTGGTRAQCTFSGAVDNLMNFAQGFSNWGDWFEVTVRPQNNVYGAMLLAQVELDQRITNALNIEKEQLGWSGGFMSQKRCETVETPRGPKENCIIVTPGVTISEALNKSLGAGQDALIEADEIDEIISALLQQLTQQAFTGVNGLLGLSEGSANGGSYLDGLKRGEGDSIGFSNPNRRNIIQDDIQREIIDLIIDAENQIGECDLELTDELSDALFEAEAELESSELILVTLSSLNAQYQSARDAAARNDVYLEFLALQTAGYLHDSFDVIGFETELEEVRLDVEDFEDQIDDECE